MNKIAFIYNDVIINWSSIVIALAVVCAACLAFALAVRKKGLSLALAVMLPLSMLFSGILSRVIHWYCRTDQYESIGQAFSDFSVGGFSIIGVILGCLVAALIVRALGLCKSLGALLDVVSPAAALGIGLGRLSFLFNYADRGKVFIENEANRRLPIGSAVINMSSGATEWRFATFFIQALVAAAILVVLLYLILRMERRELRSGGSSDGNVFFVFVALYFASEILLDSTRYDALFLRSNGFVSLMQIVAAVAVVFTFAFVSYRSVKFNGFKFRHVIIWVLFLGGLGLAGYMEYYVQRHGNLYMLSYSLMGGGLVLSSLCFLVTQATTLRKLTREDLPAE